MNNIFINLKNKLVTFITSFIQNRIIKNYLERKEVFRKKEELKNLHNSFTKQFGITPDEVKKVMRKQSNLFPSLTQTDSDYLNQKLIEGRKSMIEKNYHGPFFYEPEISDIHNENPDRLSYPKLSQVIKKDDDLSIQSLRYQENGKILKLKEKVKNLLITRG